MGLGQQLAPHVPFLRRYARALAGSQSEGDRHVRAALQVIVDAPGAFARDVEPRLALYGVFQQLLNSALAANTASGTTASGTTASGTTASGTTASGTTASGTTARARPGRAASAPRQALLLTAMEGFTVEDAAYLLDVDAAAARALVAQALADIDGQGSARVLIIEDEPIIAMDIETIVHDMGHEVTGIAITREEAVALAMEERPGLVLADIQLADDSSGIDAVQDILARFSVPVIFITAFPERLLTGHRPEPIFLITKPFQRSTVKAAIGQALFFNEAMVPVG